MGSPSALNRRDIQPSFPGLGSQPSRTFLRRGMLMQPWPFLRRGMLMQPWHFLHRGMLMQPWPFLQRGMLMRPWSFLHRGMLMQPWPFLRRGMLMQPWPFLQRGMLMQPCPFLQRGTQMSSWSMDILQLMPGNSDNTFNYTSLFLFNRVQTFLAKQIAKSPWLSCLPWRTGHICLSGRMGRPSSDSYSCRCS